MPFGVGNATRICLSKKTGANARSRKKEVKHGRDHGNPTVILGDYHIPKEEPARPDKITTAFKKTKKNAKKLCDITGRVRAWGMATNRETGDKNIHQPLKSRGTEAVRGQTGKESVFGLGFLRLWVG